MSNIWKRRLTFWLTTLLWCWFSALIVVGRFQAQDRPSVHGTIKDDSTGVPISGANVYIVGTTLGTITDVKGRFEIVGIPFGRCQVVASMLGYYSQERTLTLDRTAPKAINFSLLPQIYSLPPQDIRADFPDEWKRHLEKFTRALLGASENSLYCVIKNPEVIDFSIDEDGALRASAAAPLEIENRSLGYRLIYALLDFSSKRSLVSYQGEVRYQNLTTMDSAMMLSWNSARLAAYQGSMRHFLTALLSNKCAGEGFLITSVNQPNWSDLKKGQIGGRDEILILPSTSSLHEKEISFPRYLRVIYTGRGESSEYTRYRELYWYSGAIPQEQLVSWITLPYGRATIDDEGTPRNPSEINVYGYWAWLRVADALPRDYFPP